MATWEPGVGVVELPGGRRIRGRALRRPLPDGPRPDLGVYLLGRDPGPFPWDHRWVAWRDMRTPTDPDAAIAALAEAWERAADERVEVACRGGVGRTGTALAAIAVLAGIEPSAAVGWVRHRFQRRAVETPWQRRWVEQLHPPGPTSPG